MLLSLEGVSKSYDGVRMVLKGVDLELSRGEIFLVLGPSGTGKTTLLMIASGLEEPDSGRVTLLGHELTKMDPDERAAVRLRHVSFIFEGFVLLEDLNVLENVLLPLRLKGSVDEDRALKLLERLEIRDKAHRPIGGLSMGEKQRVAIARALVDPRDLLLADDPTSNLDDRRVKLVSDLLREIVDGGTGLLVVSQDPRLRAHLRPDRTAILEGGRLVEAQ